MSSFSPSDSDLVQVRTHRMLSRNQSQRYKVKLGLRTWLALAVGVWMIYQLRVFLNHKQSSESENGLSVKVKNQPDKLKLGRKGLVLMGSEGDVDEEVEVEEQSVDVDEEERSRVTQQEEVEEQSVDVDEEELDTVRFDDPMDSLNDDNASTDQHGDEEDDNTDKVGTRIHSTQK